MGTWNILSLNRPAALRRVTDEMKKYKLSILALQEMRWKGCDVMDVKEHTVFYSCGDRCLFGTGFIVEKRIRHSVIEFIPIDERLCALRLRSRFFNIALINVHAPTEDKDDDYKDNFYDKLQASLSKLPQNDVKIVLGDMNAQVGQEQVFLPTIGLHSVHEDSNDNGFRLIDFAASNNMVVSSTCFPHKNIHKVTWCSPNGQTENQIDHVLINRRHASDILDVRSCRGADCDTDHYLVRIKYKQRISLVKMQRGVRQEKFDSRKLVEDNDARKQYESKIREKLIETRNSEQTEETGEEDANDIIESTWTNLKNTIIEAANETVGIQTTKKRNDWYDDECKQKIEERNKARMKMLNRKTRAAVEEFNEKRKQARNECRKKKRMAEKEKFQHIVEMQETGNIREMYKEIKDIKKGFQPRTTLCKNGQGQLIGDSTQILNRWAEYFEELLGNNTIPGDMRIL